ncbi:hypothetical protein SAMN06298216_0700 [Spirosomataceae bacterium TFI 002]|nr:hypothetical protein SAMN06298216_0700 [Spirosomataceae bacterium TFI 002]
MVEFSLTTAHVKTPFSGFIQIIERGKREVEKQVNGVLTFKNRHFPFKLNDDILSCERVEYD